MEQISFIVERLNSPPFNKGYNTLTELDTKSSFEILDLICEIIRVFYQKFFINNF
jgi:hypothetical protein